MTNNNNFLSSVTMRGNKIMENGSVVESFSPVIRSLSREPGLEIRGDIIHNASRCPRKHLIVVVRQPTKTFAANNTRKGVVSVQKLVQTLRMERLSSLINKARNTIFFFFGLHGLSSHNLHPPRGCCCLIDIKNTSVHHQFEWHIRSLGANNIGFRVHLFQQAFDFHELSFINEISFVQQKDVGEFDLIDQKTGQATNIIFSHSFFGILDIVGGFHDSHKVNSIDHGDQSIKFCPIIQSHTIGILKSKSFSDLLGFRNTGTFNENVIKFAFLSQFLQFQQQIFAKSTANAPILHLDHFFFGLSDRPNQLSIDIEFSHIVHNNSNSPLLFTLSLVFFQNVLHQSSFSGTQKTTKESNRDGFPRLLLPLISHLI
mmetsp:Transcript_36599/g.57441  ORF Transcript_36599/g.57441 Transcript_36599/m.57441 type:complete len:372 (+) Transcript_36599:372-1487(+)